MPGIESNRLCDHCAITQRDRVECPDCLANLCISCWKDEERKIQWIKNHHVKYPHHKQLSWILPEHHYVLKEYDDDCSCIDDIGCIMHCNRCLKR